MVERIGQTAKSTPCDIGASSYNTTFAYILCCWSPRLWQNGKTWPDKASVKENKSGGTHHRYMFPVLECLQSRVHSLLRSQPWLHRSAFGWHLALAVQVSMYDILGLSSRVWSVKGCQCVCHKHWDQAASDSMLWLHITSTAGDVKLTGQTQAALQAE